MFATPIALGRFTAAAEERLKLRSTFAPGAEEEEDGSGVTYVWVEEFLVAPLLGESWRNNYVFLLPYSASFWEWPPLAVAVPKLVEQAH